MKYLPFLSTLAHSSYAEILNDPGVEFLVSNSSKAQGNNYKDHTFQVNDCVSHYRNDAKNEGRKFVLTVYGIPTPTICLDGSSNANMIIEMVHRLVTMDEQTGCPPLICDTPSEENMVSLHDIPCFRSNPCS